MFTFSKIFWLIVSPVTFFTVLLFAGAVLLFTRFRQTGRYFVATAAIFILIVGILPIGNWLIERLENRFPVNPDIPADVSGIIVLGGTINQYITASRGQPALTRGGERLTEFIYLARRFPGARLIFTGGSGSLFDQSLKEADAARMFLNRMGLPESRVIYESGSRNTLENAQFSRKLAGDAAAGRWLLITSAMHMPRAMGVFRKAGWDVIAYPVDYSSDGSGSFELGFRPLGGLLSLDEGGREWVGLIAYWLLGRTEELFASPDRPTDN